MTMTTTKTPGTFNFKKAENGEDKMSKEQMRAESEAAIERFKANGGSVSRLPGYSPLTGEQRIRQAASGFVAKLPVPTRDFDPATEARGIAKLAQVRAQKMEEYRKAKMHNKEVEKPILPWEE